MWVCVITKTGEVEVYREYVGGYRGTVEDGTPGGLTSRGPPPPPPVGLQTAPLQTAGVSGGTARERQDETLEGRGDLLRWRAGQVDVGVQKARGPDVGEAEISAVHFLGHSAKYW